ncbi:MAG: 50S ribosomal protein L4 [Candidatus Levybacteria bacterium]|nr:50S ribosomal protein L4 [Candidatus Levybacteria bacterium]
MPAKKSKVPAKSQSASGGKSEKSKVAQRKKEVVKKAVTKIPSAKSPSLSAQVYNTQGKVVSRVTLPKEIFGAKINNQLMAQAVRVYLANQRRGTVSTQTRGEVTGSTKKVWRQKGTGRARHGSRKAPIFVGGGVVFGPKPRDYSLKLSKKMKKVALFSALSLKQNTGSVKIIAGLEKIEPKTKQMNSTLGKLGFDQKKRKVLLIVPSPAKNGLENIYRAARNLEGIDVVSANLINTYEILEANSVVLMKDSIDKIKENFLKEKN